MKITRWTFHPFGMLGVIASTIKTYMNSGYFNIRNFIISICIILIVGECVFRLTRKLFKKYDK